MDDVDFANEQQQRTLAATIAARVRTTGQGLIYCEECDAEIPMARRQAIPGCRTCISCQEYIEHQGFW